MQWQKWVEAGRRYVWVAVLPVVVTGWVTSCSLASPNVVEGDAGEGPNVSGGPAGSSGGAGAIAGASAQNGGAINVTEGGTPGAGGQDSDCQFESCDCIEGETQPCGPSASVGICHPGMQTCQQGGWGECVGALAAQARDCTSAMDNDCDGSPDNTIDEACKCTPGKTRACGDHPGLDGSGPCQAGEQACSGAGSSGVWGPCVGSVGPKPADSCEERGDDSDCDGAKNDDCSCVVGDTKTCAQVHAASGVCAAVALNCAVSGKWPSAAACAPSEAEVCAADNKDEDCDGQVNEACVCTNGKTQKCGKCNNGSQICANGTWGTCTDDLILETPNKGPNMLCISAGTFDMGGDYHGLSVPVHPVTLPAFWMDEKEVSAGQYAACVTAGKCTATAVYEGCNYNASGKTDHPINCLYQTAAAAFCTWAGKRLPIEEEWEYAARGTDGRTYPWGNEVPGARARWNSTLYTVAVGSLSGRSPFGLYEMAGNVSEWTSSHSCDYPASGFMPTTCADVNDNYYFTYRGGDYSSTADAISTFARGLDPLDTASTRIGFRCAKSL